MVTVKNKKTGVLSKFELKKWTKIKENPYWAGVYEIISINPVNVPEEVKKLEAKNTPLINRKKTN